MFVITQADDHTVTIQVPPDPNAHKLMGRFQAARRTDSGRYLLPADQAATFTKHAQLASWQVTDQRGQATGKALGPLPECRNCGQPTRRRQADDPTRDYSPPKFCPDCGAVWDQFVMTVTEIDLHAMQACPACGHTQRGAFTHCAGCGAIMPTPEQRRPVMTRERLDEPQHIGDAIVETLDAWPEADPDHARAMRDAAVAAARQAARPKETTP